MKRVIVDYAKLTNEILTLLVEKFPDGYDDSNIVRFKNAKNETIEAVEVRTEDTIYLVKVSTKLADRIENFDDDDIDEPADDIDPLKDLEIGDDDDDADDDMTEKETRRSDDSDGDGDDDDDDEDDKEDRDYEEEDEEDED
ncbi:DNA primase [Flavobacterium psychrophilum]|nr:DNA primase [Flavobacterium psychrophilum]AOE51219.1 DNA primase [Flavobacterium psychrophilum]